MRHPHPEAPCLQAFLKDGADIKSKAIGEKNASIALCADGSRELARIHAWRGHQLLKSTRRAIEPGLVKGPDDLGDKDALAALPEAA